MEYQIFAKVCLVLNDLKLSKLSNNRWNTAVFGGSHGFVAVSLVSYCATAMPSIKVFENISLGGESIKITTLGGKGNFVYKP